ncbi:hypothetical protein N7468_006309 [Penicillium chermesinum]|uniref:Hemagglutinin protein n=1 Tax=Penicillium chermesinum TaxID=63820 RepID=A0A9W9NUT0_9EURO|nr:uncharacterized protein N7468_006309 [Penicillium chermesinum]KAJ5225084.1 hypothetical protein N7468_006309 [Penicillium chermesinum]
MESFYSEKAGYDQSRHDVLSLSRSMRNLNQRELSDHASGVISPTTEMEGKLRNSQRRRVPVAVGFPTKSTFLALESQHRMAGLQRTPDFDLSNHPQGFARPSSMGFVSYDDEQSASYSQPPSYGMVGAPSGTLVEYGTSSYSPKPWDSVMNGRSSNECIYPESEANSFSHGPFTYMVPSQGMMPSSDLSPCTGSGLTAVLSSDAPGPDRILPTPTCRSQQAPNTTAGFLPVDFSGLPPPSDSKNAFWSPRLGGSPDQRQSPAHVVPSNDQFTLNSPLSKDVNSTAPELLFSCLPISTAEDSSPPLSTTAPLGVTSAGYSVLETLETEYPLPPEVQTRSFSRDRLANSSQRFLALTDECSPEIYGYSSSEKTKVRRARASSALGNSSGASGTLGSSSDSSGSVSGSGDDERCSTATLISGLPYTRVQHRDSPACLPFNLLPDALPEYHRSVATYVHRASVGPLGNQGAY